MTGIHRPQKRALRRPFSFPGALRDRLPRAGAPLPALRFLLLHKSHI
jgi:hypothetical protein